MNSQINIPAAAKKMNVFGATSSAPAASFSCSAPDAKRLAPGFAAPRPGKGGFNPAMG